MVIEFEQRERVWGKERKETFIGRKKKKKRGKTEKRKTWNKKKINEAEREEKNDNK